MSVIKEIDTDYLENTPFDQIDYNKEWRKCGPEGWVKLMANPHISNGQVQTAIRMMANPVKMWNESDKVANKTLMNGLPFVFKVVKSWRTFAREEEFHDYEEFFKMLSERPEMSDMLWKSMYHDYAQVIIDSPYASSEVLLTIMKISKAPFVALRAAAHKNVSILDAAAEIAECCGYGNGGGIKFDVWPTDYSITLEQKADAFLMRCDWDEETLANTGFDMKILVIAS